MLSYTLNVSSDFSVRVYQQNVIPHLRDVILNMIIFIKCGSLCKSLEHNVKEYLLAYVGKTFLFLQIHIFDRYIFMDEECHRSF